MILLPPAKGAFCRAVQRERSSAARGTVARLAPSAPGPVSVLSTRPGDKCHTPLTAASLCAETMKGPRLWGQLQADGAGTWDPVRSSSFPDETVPVPANFPAVRALFGSMVLANSVFSFPAYGTPTMNYEFSALTKSVYIGGWGAGNVEKVATFS